MRDEGGDDFDGCVGGRKEGGREKRGGREGGRSAKAFCLNTMHLREMYRVKNCTRAHIVFFFEIHTVADPSTF